MYIYIVYLNVGTHMHMHLSTCSMNVPSGQKHKTEPVHARADAFAESEQLHAVSLEDCSVFQLKPSSYPSSKGTETVAGSIPVFTVAASPRH